MIAKTVGELRKLLKGLDDNVRIGVDWGDYEPADEDPCVVVEGLEIRTDYGKKYLSVLVGLSELEGGV